MIPSTIFEELLFSTVRIAVKDKNAVSSMGTGFFIHKSISENRHVMFICTCKHVIENSTEGTIFLQSNDNGKPLLGDPYRIFIEDFESLWIKHETSDLVIMPLTRLNKYFDNKIIERIFFKSISMDIIPKNIDIEEKIDVVENVYFIGYPNDIYDKVNMLPVVRTGITASPFFVNFNGTLTFLIDASIFKGSSGSPVLICNIGSYFHKKSKNLMLANKLFFLGVVSYTMQGENNQYIDLGVCVKSFVIGEMIDKFIVDNKIN